MMSRRPWEVPAPEPGADGRVRLLGLDRAATTELLRELGEPAWRGDQLYEGLYRHRWHSWERFTAFSKDLRARLAERADLSRPVIVESAASEDGSTKHAFRLEDGHLIEGVHMPYGARTTLCLSSQVGCALGCTFCATGAMGIQRNLSSGEIVGQVLAMLDHHRHPAQAPVNLVFMGMGEPLHNLDHVMAAFRLLSDPSGIAIPPRRITVSTAGLVPGIGRLGTFRPRPRLALSLNATTDDARTRIMPVARAWNLEALAAALSAFPLEKGERITLEYVLLKGVTDTPEDGRRLVVFARRFPCKVNLIPFNPHEAEAGAEAHGSGEADGRPQGAAQEGPRVGAGFAPPDEARINALCAQLAKAGLTVSVRRSRGQDVAGACGQLARRGRGSTRANPDRSTP